MMLSNPMRPPTLTVAETCMEEFDPALHARIPARRKKTYARKVKVRKMPLTNVKHGWVPKDEIAVIAERKIPGMVYVFDPKAAAESGGSPESKVYIDTAKSVGEPAEKGSVPNSRYYNEMQPEYRACYLDWLANGMNDMDYHPAYPYFYVYGLERRLLHEKAAGAERQDIIEELQRLRRLYIKVNRVCRVVQYVLDFAELCNNPYESTYISNPNYYLSLPTKLHIDISNCIHNGAKLTEKQLLQWFSLVPNRYFDHKNIKLSYFRLEFAILFEQIYGDGLAVEPPAEFLNLEYESLTSEFKIAAQPTHAGRPIYDIRHLNAPLAAAYDIATKVDSSHRRNTKPKFWYFHDLRGTRPDLWSLSRIKSYNYLTILAAKAQMNKERILAKDLISDILSESVGQIRIDQWDRTNEVFSIIGFGLAPDRMLYLMPPKREAAVVIYDLCNKSELDPEYSEKYFAALAQLGVCSYLIHTLSLNIAESQANLHQFIEAIPELTAVENAGLRANVEFLLESPPDRSYLKRLGEWSSANDTDSFRPVLISLVRDRQHLDPKTVSLVEKIYKTLNLDTKLVYSDLHDGGAVTNNDSLRQRQSSKAELDSQAVATIRTDTEKVSQLLGDIFDTDMQDQQVTDHAAATGQKQKVVSVAGLDSKHSQLLQQLLAKEYWREDEFAALASQSGLLAVGAAETINEWVFNRYDESLLEEHDGFHVAPSISKVLQKELNNGSIR